MLIAGWGKKSKKIADAGLHRCQNCNNTATFEIRELANYASAYFIKIAKWKKQFYLVCSICEAGYELTEEAKNELLKLSIEQPNNQEITEVWNDMDLLFADYLKDGKDIKKWNDYAMHELNKKGHNSGSVEYVLAHDNQNLLDSIKKEN